MKASDPAAVRAARRVKRILPDGTVYGASLGILALLEQPRTRHRERIAKLVKQLVKGQCRNGQWTYAYRATARKKSGDNSNTQLAALALAAARRRGFPVPVEAFARLRGYLETSQNADGGFGYARNQRSSSYGSMTAGCAMALALSMQVVSPESDAAAHPPVRRALLRAALFDPQHAPRVDASIGRGHHHAGGALRWGSAPALVRQV